VTAILHMMRDAAIARHRFLNVMFEAACPVAWERHMRIVRAVYGY
jgi:hypothetical protein